MENLNYALRAINAVDNCFITAARVPVAPLSIIFKNGFLLFFLGKACNSLDAHLEQLLGSSSIR